MIELSSELVVVIMFGLLLLFIFIGYPLGIVLAGVAVVVGLLGFGSRVFNILYSQAFNILTNYTLIAIPLFVFMGVMVERSGIGKKLFDTLEIWLHNLRGHLAIVVVLTGTALAACTGIIAGSVVMLGMVGLPHMMARGYNKELACGAICASGTLGILIPPSVMLVIYGPMAGLSVGKLFMAAFGPGLTLSALYLLYIAITCQINRALAPSAYDEAAIKIKLSRKVWLLLISVVPIVTLILAVLGSIFFGVAAPTEAAAVGAFAAAILALANRKLTWFTLKEVTVDTGGVTGMIALVSIGAMSFTSVLLALGGGDVVAHFIIATPGGKWGVFILVQAIVFILGMFIDWLGIIFIVVPVVTPIAEALGFDPLWFAIMICVNLQTAFLTPPFAVAIFFLRGIIPKEYGITTRHIIRGVVPFITLILVGIGLCVAFPELILWLPNKMIK